MALLPEFSLLIRFNTIENVANQEFSQGNSHLWRE